MTDTDHISDYVTFLESKTDLGDAHGFEPIEIPAFLKDFQAHLVNWAIRRGRAAILADCGLGKTPILYSVADNIVRHTNGRVLILVPLGVLGQKRSVRAISSDSTREASRNGKFSKRIVATNYEKLHLFNPGDFSGVVCDESSILKNFDGKTKEEITEFMRTIPYRLLCSATAAPNDYPELGTSAEALGEMGYSDMITKFFKQETSKDHLGWGRTKYRMRAHGEKDFWRWVCSWARACRRPSDLGFDDAEFILPELDHARARNRGQAEAAWFSLWHAGDNPSGAKGRTTANDQGTMPSRGRTGRSQATSLLFGAT